jgi:glycosyltransferase involved in cell wall biosynthesis
VTVDILYVAWNRREMTTASWAWLMAHTNWDHVHKLVVYDDGSDDGTQEFLREQCAELDGMNGGLVADFRVSDLRSPPAVMNHYLATSEADFFAKIDNDIAVPGGWLEALLSVMLKHRELELLGMEAGMVELAGRDGKEWDGRYGFEPCTNIGGVGLMRVAAFRKRPAIPFRGRFGFTEWQDRYDLNRAWIVPDIHCPQLDRVPLEPWISLAKEYVENGWSRPWPPYSGKWMRPYYEWMLEKEEVE